MRTGGELLVECLKVQGVEIAFGVPGESYLAVLDALHDADLRFVNARHESGAAFMAAASGKLTGRAGVAFVTRGPGATNASIGVHSAMQDSTPLVLFVGQIARRDRDREAFQEIDYRAFFGPIAKWVTEVDHAERLPEIVSRAFALAEGGRPGPIVVALPEDMLRDETDAPTGSRVRLAPAYPSSDALDDAVQLLDGAKRPLLIAGGGGWKEEGRAALRAIAERANVPVTLAFRSQDLMDNRSAAFIGDCGLGKPPHILEAIDEADVILALGVRFGETLTDGFTRLSGTSPSQNIIHVHANAADLCKTVTPRLAIQSDVNAFLTALQREALARHGSERLSKLRGAHEQVLEARPQSGDLDMASVMRILRGRLDEDVIVTNGAGNFSIWPNRHFSYGPEARLIAPQSGSMGYGVPAAVAVSILHPGRQVVCFAGDGDFQMSGMELATAAQFGATPIVLVVDNASYGTIRMHQERDYPHRVSGTVLRNPDFVKLAEGFGFPGERVERTEEFETAFRRIAEGGRGGLLHLMTDTEAISPMRSITELRGGR